MSDVAFAEIRRSVMSEWVRPPGIFVAREERALDRLLGEIDTAEKVGLWSVIPVATGKIIEAILRKKLELAGHGTAAAKLTGLGQLIEFARKRAILGGYKRPRLGSSSLGAAAVLRNWEAHFNSWHADPSELRATQSEVLLSCATEALFPTAPKTFSHPSLVFESWRDLSPSAIIKQFTNDDGPLTSKLLREFEEVTRHIVRYGQLRMVTRFEDLVRSRSMPASLLKSALAAEFAQLVKHAASARAKNVLWSVDMLKRQGLREHARTFAILLPLDDDMFKHLMKRSTTAAVFYITACYRAEPALFAKRMLTIANDKQIVQDFWHDAAARWPVGNTADFLFRFRFTIRRKWLAGMPDTFMEDTLRDATLTERVKMLRIFDSRMLRRDSRLTSVRDQVAKMVSAALAGAPLSLVQGIPYYLEHNRFIEDRAAVHLLDEAIERIRVVWPSSDEEWHAVARTLWDIQLYSRACADSARTAASEILVRCTHIPSWPALWLVGMLHACGSGLASTVPSGRPAWTIEDDDPHIDDNRWYAYAVALGLFETGAVIPHTLLARVKRDIEPARAEDPPFSTEVVAHIYEMLNRLSTA